MKDRRLTKPCGSAESSRSSDGAAPADGITGDTWGRWGTEPPCEHLLALRKFLTENDLHVWSEDGAEPDGWCNVGCQRCHRAYEVTLRAPWEPI